MNQEVLEEIIRWFYTKEKKYKPGHQMIMLMDNFSGHKLGPPAFEITVQGFRGYQYKSLLVLFLPPNTTTTIQPLD